MILCQLPEVDFNFEEVIDDDTLQELLEEIGTVASVYHKPASEFIHPKIGPAPTDISKLGNNEETIDILDSEEDEDDLDLDLDEEKPKKKSKKQQEDEEDDEDFIDTRSPTPQKSTTLDEDLADFFS